MMAIAFMYSFIPINICSVPTVWKAVINICGLQLLSFFYVTSPHGFPGLALSRFETLIPKSIFALNIHPPAPGGTVGTGWNPFAFSDCVMFMQYSLHLSL